MIEKPERIIEQEEIDLIDAHDEKGLTLYHRFKSEEKKLWDTHFDKLADCQLNYVREKEDLMKRRQRNGNDDGQGLVEYALILVLVAVVVIVILALLGPAIGNIFSNLVNSL